MSTSEDASATTPSSGLDAQVLVPYRPESRRRARCDRTAQAITGLAGGPGLWLKAHNRQAVIRRLFVRFM
jgi:hypothetical protein